MKIILNDDDIIVVDSVELSTFVQTTFKEGGVSNKHY